MARGRRRTQPPWGSLVVAALCLSVALGILVALPAASAGPQGSFIATPGRLILPATTTPTVPAATPGPATPRPGTPGPATATPAR